VISDPIRRRVTSCLARRLTRHLLVRPWQNMQPIKSVLPFCSTLPIQYTPKYVELTTWNSIKLNDRNPPCRNKPRERLRISVQYTCTQDINFHGVWGSSCWNDIVKVKRLFVVSIFRAYVLFAFLLAGDIIWSSDMKIWTSDHVFW